MRENFLCLRIDLAKVKTLKNLKTDFSLNKAFTVLIHCKFTKLQQLICRMYEIYQMWSRRLHLHCSFKLKLNLHKQYPWQGRKTVGQVYVLLSIVVFVLYLLLSSSMCLDCCSQQSPLPDKILQFNNTDSSKPAVQIESMTLYFVNFQSFIRILKFKRKL